MTAGTRPSYLQDMADVERRLRDVERATARIPARLGGGGAGVSFQWIRVDGGNTLNASPLVTGIKAATIPATVPDALDPGAVNASTGVETTAPTGAFPDGVGYGTLVVQSAGAAPVYSRVLVRNGRSVSTANNIVSGWLFWDTGATVTIAKATSGSLTFMVVS